ncbi:transmembrane adaptor Erv26-domain-containing protein [Lobosporangium transversale]|uniref:Transmembrane adaptor Erv26-domain-containing protein n=1 Tax=Lobosporangium transversale TaxID=64571 RepID=A0A1Y2GEN3_9FUNG|nr:transmembrane adaptor Erv26-domain-containing protein [Lobosporangium transversale]ORZ08785.1 transmembrane adaptor Erv26-domain-containing protein [Lobosporangium transversale]|eukprot:XP_021878568.1 transmembrane adaptor Erv26-domain-containing protein [Lobosporangium transversale]
MPTGFTFTLISFAGAVLAFLFTTLSLACGLYYMAELVEEYTVWTKKIIKGLTMVVVVLHISLWLLDGLPFTKILFSLGCHAVYSFNLTNFPFISLTSVPFLLSCVLVLVDHFMWFQYFSRHYHTFASIASFFGICVWMVPFAYFISLSANDNALPSFDKSQQDSKQKKNGILKSLFGAMLNKKDTVLPAVVETPQYSGFAGSLGSSSRPGTPFLSPSSSSTTTAGPVYTSFNPEKNQLRPEFSVSRPSSRNSNYGHAHESAHEHEYQNTPSSTYGGQQSYSSSSSAVYGHSSSTITNRF